MKLLKGLLVAAIAAKQLRNLISTNNGNEPSTVTSIIRFVAAETRAAWIFAKRTVDRPLLQQLQWTLPSYLVIHRSLESISVGNKNLERPFNWPRKSKQFPSRQAITLCTTASAVSECNQNSTSASKTGATSLTNFKNDDQQIPLIWNSDEKNLENTSSTIVTFPPYRHRPLGCTLEESLAAINALNCRRFPLFVSKVLPGSYADEAGIQVGDVIVGVTGIFGGKIMPLTNVDDNIDKVYV